jgi:protein SCO1/2
VKIFGGRLHSHKALLICTAAAAFGLIGCEKKEEQFAEFPAPSAQPQTLRAYWPAPDFQLTERTEKPISLRDLRGKVWVADFFYTTCPGPCPMMSSRLSDLQRATSGMPQVRLVSISADPEKDTPEVLRQYAAKFGAGENWLFLTGDKATIHELANKGFKLGVSEDGAAAEPITHSTKLVLIDQAGMIRGFYEGLGEDVSARLVADIERLLRENP